MNEYMHEALFERIGIIQDILDDGKQGPVDNFTRICRALNLAIKKSHPMDLIAEALNLSIDQAYDDT